MMLFTFIFRFSLPCRFHAAFAAFFFMLSRFLDAAMLFAADYFISLFSH